MVSSPDGSERNCISASQVARKLALLGSLRSLRLREPHTCARAILRDKLNAGLLEVEEHGERVALCAPSRATRRDRPTFCRRQPVDFPWTLSV